jgi:hypothetical protein
VRGNIPVRPSGLAIRLTRSGLSMHVAQQRAMGLYALVQAQAAVLSYVDVSLIMFVGSFFLKRNEPGKSGNVSVH